MPKLSQAGGVPVPCDRNVVAFELLWWEVRWGLPGIPCRRCEESLSSQEFGDQITNVGVRLRSHGNKTQRTQIVLIHCPQEWRSPKPQFCQDGSFSSAILRASFALIFTPLLSASLLKLSTGLMNALAASTREVVLSSTVVESDLSSDCCVASS